MLGALSSLGSLLMSPEVIGSVLGVGGNLLGGAFTNSNSAKMSKKQYKYNLALQMQAQAFAERMANTAHQREVADLRKAGLNPILSATGGNGAPAPVTGTNSVGMASPADMSSIGSAFTKSVSDLADASSNSLNSRTSAKAQQSQAAVNESQVKVNNAQAALTGAKAVKEIEESKVWKDAGKGYDEIKNLMNGFFNDLSEAAVGSVSSGSSVSSGKSQKGFFDRTKQTLQLIKDGYYSTDFPQGKGKGMSFQPERYRGTNIWYGDYVDSNGKTRKGYYRK